MKKIIAKLTAVLLVVCMMTTSVVGGTLAAYTSESSGVGQMVVAKWGVGFTKQIEGSEAETLSQNFEISIADTKIENNQVATGKIAPGDKGFFYLGISDTTTEVAYAYSIKIFDEGVPIRFFTNEECTERWANISGSVAVGESIPTDVASKKVYWQWHTIDGATDTAWGLDAANGNGELQFSVEMNATQILGYISEDTDFEDLSAGDGAVYVENINLGDAPTTWTNEEFDGTVVFGDIRGTSTFEIYAPNADVIFEGDILGVETIVSQAKTDTTTIKGNIDSNTEVIIKSGGLKVESTASVGKISIAEENTTAKQISIAGNVEELVIDGGITPVVTIFGGSPEITNNVPGAVVIVEGTSAPTIIPTETETYVSNRTAEKVVVQGATDIQDDASTSTATPGPTEPTEPTVPTEPTMPDTPTSSGGVTPAVLKCVVSGQDAVIVDGNTTVVEKPSSTEYEIVQPTENTIIPIGYTATMSGYCSYHIELRNYGTIVIAEDSTLNTNKYYNYSTHIVNGEWKTEYTMNNYGTITSNGTTRIDRQIFNYGTIANEGVTVHEGKIFNYGTIANEGALDAWRGEITDDGAFTNSGTLIVQEDNEIIDFVTHIGDGKITHDEYWLYY